MTAVDWASLPPIDVLTGGTPCQDVSVAGRRAGMRAGTRSGLWASMVDAIDILRPRLVVWENVKGALSATADSGVEQCPWCLGDETATGLRALGRVLGDLADIGFDAAWVGLSASDVGAPHGRFRVFVIATPRDPGWVAADADSQHLARQQQPAPGRHDDAATDAAQHHGAVADTDDDRRETQQPSGRGTQQPEPAGHRACAAADAQLRGWVGGARQAGGQPQQRTAAAGHRRPDWGKYAPAIERWERVIGRPAPAPTQPNAAGTPQLSAPFTEWLMGLPDGWVTGTPDLTRAQALHVLGNGVVPLQGAVAIRRGLDILARGQVAP